MKTQTKIGIAIGCFAFIVSGFLLYLGAWLIAPGSYPRAEIYEFYISEDSLLKIIDEWKNENPDYNLEEFTDLDRKDRYWNYRYFYYPDKNLKIMTYVRGGIGKSSTTNFAFIRTLSMTKFSTWTDVNDSFWWWKNTPEKKEFEKRIVIPIREKIKNKTLEQQKHHPVNLQN